MALTVAVGLGIAMLLGLGFGPSIYVAVALAFSSTIVIVKLLSDQREIDALHGRIAMGILILQDIAVVVAMIDDRQLDRRRRIALADRGADRGEARAGRRRHRRAADALCAAARAAGARAIAGTAARLRPRLGHRARQRSAKRSGSARKSAPSRRLRARVDTVSRSDQHAADEHSRFPAAVLLRQPRGPGRSRRPSATPSVPRSSSPRSSCSAAADRDGDHGAGSAIASAPAC